MHCHVLLYIVVDVFLFLQVRWTLIKLKFEILKIFLYFQTSSKRLCSHVSCHPHHLLAVPRIDFDKIRGCASIQDGNENNNDSFYCRWVLGNGQNVLFLLFFHKISIFTWILAHFDFPCILLHLCFVCIFLCQRWTSREQSMFKVLALSFWIRRSVYFR